MLMSQMFITFEAFKLNGEEEKFSNEKGYFVQGKGSNPFPEHFLSSVLYKNNFFSQNRNWSIAVNVLKFWLFGFVGSCVP